MITSLRRKFRLLFTDRRGMAMVEFAAATPFLGLLLIGVTDLGRGFSEMHRIQQAANRTIEMAQASGNDTNYDYLRAEAAAAAGVPLESVSIRQWFECEGTPSTAECADNQQTARYVRLTIRTTYKPMFSSALFRSATTDGLVPIAGAATLRWF